MTLIIQRGTIMNTNNANGLWVHILHREYARVGQITMAVGSDHHLLKMRSPKSKGGPPMCELMTRSDLCTDDARDHYVNIFNTEAELDAWVEWADTPDDGRPRVVNL